MTDPHAHYDDLTEASYVAPLDELSRLGYEAQVAAPARRRELRTLLDRLAPSNLDILTLDVFAEDGEGSLSMSLRALSLKLQAARHLIITVHQLLGDD